MGDGMCSVGKNCMEVLAKRLYVMFEEICTEAEFILLYFKKRNFQGLGAGVFDRDFENPRAITMNPYAWDMIKKRGNIYRFDPSMDFFLTGTTAPPEKTKKDEEQLLD
jgi:hypothetical protein